MKTGTMLLIGAGAAAILLFGDKLGLSGGAEGGGGGKKGTVSTGAILPETPYIQEPQPTPVLDAFSYIAQTPFGLHEEPLTTVGKKNGSTVYSGGQSGHTNVLASSLPEKYWIDAGSKGVTLVSSLPSEKKADSSGYGGIAPSGGSAGASGYRPGGTGTWTPSGYVTRY